MSSRGIVIAQSRGADGDDFRGFLEDANDLLCMEDTVDTQAADKDHCKNYHRRTPFSLLYHTLQGGWEISKHSICIYTNHIRGYSHSLHSIE